MMGDHYCTLRSATLFFIILLQLSILITDSSNVKRDSASSRHSLHKRRQHAIAALKKRLAAASADDASFAPYLTYLLEQRHTGQKESSSRIRSDADARRRSLPRVRDAAVASSQLQASSLSQQLSNKNLTQKERERLSLAIMAAPLAALGG